MLSVLGLFFSKYQVFGLQFVRVSEYFVKMLLAEKK